MRVMTVVGARPQFIKAAVVSRSLAAAGAQESIVHTGQHFDAAMSDVFFRELGLPPPAHHLGIGGLGHGAMTGRMIEAIEALLLVERPDWVLVFGDTNSTLAGALAASKLNIPVAHVEAGMRSFNRRMPEEQNRVVADHLSTLNLVTHAHAAELLAREGITRGVEIVGDVMFDASLLFREAADRTNAVERLGLAGVPYALATVHRAENTDSPERLAGIVRGLEAVGAESRVVLSLHPRTMKVLAARGITFDPARVQTIEPVGYLEMLALERSASLILTDSGGVQKEAFFARVPCVTMRDETEWGETVELGWNALVGADASRIVEAAGRMRGVARGATPPIYGDGSAGDRVVSALGRAAGTA